MRHGRKCKWEEIEIGEVFACDGCWEIFYKKSKNTMILLALNHHEKGTTNNWEAGIIFNELRCGSFCQNYKLPLAIQQLWRTD